MLEHIEFAGVHSGDAAMVMPPHAVRVDAPTVRKATHELAREAEVIAAMNISSRLRITSSLCSR